MKKAPKMYYRCKDSAQKGPLRGVAERAWALGYMVWQTQCSQFWLIGKLLLLSPVLSAKPGADRTTGRAELTYYSGQVRYCFIGSAYSG